MKVRDREQISRRARSFSVGILELLFEWLYEMHIQREALTEKYLGLPTPSGRLTERHFEHIHECSRCRVQGWCDKKLSCVAKEVLLKTVVQALPTYAMTCFKLTKGLRREVMTVMSMYWWVGSLDKREMHWQSWDKMYISKFRAGVEFRDF